LSGVELAEREDVDLILLDINLPDIMVAKSHGDCAGVQVIIALYPLLPSRNARQRRGKGVGGVAMYPPLINMRAVGEVKHSSCHRNDHDTLQHGK
jgi:hypothetical protein